MAALKFLPSVTLGLVLFAALTLALPIMAQDNPRQATMGLFYLSILLTLLLTYVFFAAGRAFGLGQSDGGPGIAARLQRAGFPIMHRHAWGDFGRLYALLFLVFMAPVLFSLFCTLMASAFAGFEETVQLSEDGTDGLTETQALQQIARGDIALGEGDAARSRRVLLVRDVSFALGCLLILPCFARLTPYFLWRSGGRLAPTLSETWRAVPWRLAVPFGLCLLTCLAGVVGWSSWGSAPLPLAYGLFSLLIVAWALAFAAVMARQSAPVLEAAQAADDTEGAGHD